MDGAPAAFAGDAGMSALAEDERTPEWGKSPSESVETSSISDVQAQQISWRDTAVVNMILRASFGHHP